MTAVEQLIELLAHNDIIDHKALNSNERLYKLYIILVKQAKEMEKQQMFRFTNHHHVIGEGTERFFKEEFELWYNETYGSNHIGDTNEMIDHIGDANKMVEISDEEIEQYAKQNAFNYYEFITGAKWYREQLKGGNNES